MSLSAGRAAAAAANEAPVAAAPSTRLILSSSVMLNLTSWY